ncbi:SDR family oxidoreductase [Novosphingobium sp. FKTRR1]|uniref:SDR family oxidoreductase n=1 Tax=Novosphingobium sp. FKTRR1 TaxID=2879118 RepID=UPI001CF0CC0B|nr:SDR family NAD(P)-dependent oxidoreductase [Novosphingobium sp. FKTRR1]
MQLAGKVVLVTGGTDGIGLRLARALRDAGAKVTMTGRTAARIAAAQAEGFEVLPADLAGPDGVAGLLAAISGRQFDVLVNNAGMGGTHDFREGAPVADEDERTLYLNLHAPIRLIAGMIPALRDRPEAMIVNVTSGLAIAPSTGAPVYCATKAALRSYTQALRSQLKDTHIHVLEALPPVVDTAMTAARTGSKLSPEECARQIVAAMQRNATEANVGIVRILAILNNLAPWLVRRIMLSF